MASFDTYDDLIGANTGVGTGFTQINISSSFQIAGLAYDGKYRMALQSRTDTTAPNEVYMASFDTYDDVFNANTGVGTGFTQVNISSSFQIAGMAYDGKYRMALQSRADTTAPNEVYLASFDTYDDVFSAITGVGSGFTQINISSSFQIAGLAYDGKYRMVLQSRADSTAPNEVYLASFDTFEDLISANTGVGTGFTQLNISPDFRVAGFAYESNAVPEPATMFALGGACLMFVKKRRKQ